MSVPDSEPAYVSVRGLGKSYAGVPAISEIDLDIRQGEIHSLVGENGAGKSTLIKVLSGVVSHDFGTLTVDKTERSMFSVREAELAGLVTVHQESTAFLDLDVIDNLFVGRELVKGVALLDKRAMREQARELLSDLGESIPLDVPAAELSIAQRQMVAIARALSLKSRLLILDEPTASLSAKEAQVLHRTVRRLKNEGVGILFVSHRLEEVLDLSDRVTVLRDGRLVATELIGSWSREKLIQSMVGRGVDPIDDTNQSSAEEVLRVDALSSQGRFSKVSFAVHKGEVVGLGGLVGSGRTEVVRAIMGVDDYDSGQVTLEGRPKRKGLRASLQAGIALVPEDRQHQGLVLEQSVAENAVMVVRGRLARAGWISRRKEKVRTEEAISALSIKTRSPNSPAKSLSGGNQQKIVLGKWLAAHPRVLILDEPTRGVDIGSKAEIHRLIRQLARDGASVIVVSSDLPELIELSDRIVVMRGGEIVGELTGERRTQADVLQLAFGKDVAS